MSVPSLVIPCGSLNVAAVPLPSEEPVFPEPARVVTNPDEITISVSYTHLTLPTKA